ncbi:hypothetical protein LR48_Vigan07g053600 [Vigna angularis]|uniref:Uncharacterized protein n=1 Tax=Phaseolus angularis TaxID=3914 RepID=A0A0L9UW68_PHAAN|nr:hypothetical protein LR48_Vigan07g053600 [Vigna angularis]
MTATQNQSARTTVLGFLCNWNIMAALTANTITPQRHHDWNTTIEGRDSYGSSDEDDEGKEENIASGVGACLISVDGKGQWQQGPRLQLWWVAHGRR